MAKIDPSPGPTPDPPALKSPSLTRAEVHARQVEWYQRRFSFWIPYTQEIKILHCDQTELDLPASETFVPVEEVLDRLVLKSIRKSALIRFFSFLVFLLTYFVTLTMQRCLADAYQIESAIKARLAAFSEIGEASDASDPVPALVEWLSKEEGGFLDSVFPDEVWYNGDTINATNVEEEGFVHFYNKPVGGFRLVQHRVARGDGCDLSPEFCNVYPTVWVDLDSDATTSDVFGQSRTPFGPPHDPSKYEWQPDEAGEYGGGGFMVDFPLSKTLASHKINELFSDRWIDKQTRSLETVFAVYNGNLRLFAITRELFEMHVYRSGYFVFWNCLDLARQAFLYAGFVQYYILQHHDLRQNLTLPVPESTYVNFEALVKLEMDYSSLAAINILLSTGMIFKFLVPFPKLGVFVHTLTKAGGDLVSFLGLLFLILAGYILQGHVIFGHALYEYSTLVQSAHTVVGMSLGGFDYNSLVGFGSDLSISLYHYSFVIVVPTIVLNMVIAIIFTAYDSLNEEIGHISQIDVGRDLTLSALLMCKPSLKEVNGDETVVAILARRWTQRLLFAFSMGAKGSPWGSDLFGIIHFDTTLDEDSFNEDHLLELFGKDFSYRLMGKLSPSIIKKTNLAKEKIQRLTVAKGRKYEASEDPRSLSLSEFCLLMHQLDDENDDITIGESSAKDFSLDDIETAEYKVSKIVFEQFSKEANENQDNNFRTNVRNALDFVTTEVKKLRKDVKSLVVAGGGGASPDQSGRWLTDGRRLSRINAPDGVVGARRRGSSDLDDFSSLEAEAERALRC